MNVRLCTGCNRTLPRTPDFFYRDRRQPDGLQTRCQECRAKSQAGTRANRALRAAAKAELAPMPGWLERGKPENLRLTRIMTHAVALCGQREGHGE
jgi:hypothetical protein